MTDEEGEAADVVPADDGNMQVENIYGIPSEHELLVKQAKKLAV